MSWWNRAQPKKTGPRKGPIARVRSRHSRPEPGPPRIIVQQGIGRIIGYELADGTIVKLKLCCENPMACEREECWAPWWLR